MTDAETFAVGQRVRFTVRGLGTIRPSEGTRFTEHIVQIGATGTVLIPPGARPNGWLVVEADEYPDEHVPVHPSMIEPA